MVAHRLLLLPAVLAAAEARVALKWHSLSNAPTAPIIQNCTATCLGNRSSPCQSPECRNLTQPGWQCYRTPGSDGCLMNRTSKLNCTTEMWHGQWARACCEVGWKQCPPLGCCKPGDACGTAVDGGGQCCVSHDAAQARQLAEGCCVVGVGVNCESPGQMDPCCLPSEGDKTWHPDPHAACQPRNCSNFVRCPCGIGYDCAGEQGRYQSMCCLPCFGSDPHGQCQRDQDCSSYKPCQRTGVDCLSEHGAHCCLEQPADQEVCRASCDEYRREQQQRQRWVQMAIFALLGLFSCAACGKLGQWAWRCYQPFRPIPRQVAQIQQAVDRTEEGVSNVAREFRAATTWLVDNGRSVLMPNGLTSPCRKLIEFSIRVVLTFGCTAYTNDKLRLPGGTRSAQLVGEALEPRGYVWIKKLDATREDIVAGLSEAMRIVQGHARALIFIYFAGHGTEGDAGLCWYGTDADPEDRATQFPVGSVYRNITDAALRPTDAKKHFGCSELLGELYIVNVADCCRTDDAVSAMDEDGYLARRHDAPKRNNQIGSRPEPSFLTIYTAAPGRKAGDGTEDAGSPWAQAFVARLAESPYEPVTAFLAQVGRAARNIAATAGFRQRCGRRFDFIDENMDWPVCLVPWTPAAASTGSSTAASSSPSSIVGTVVDVPPSEPTLV